MAPGVVIADGASLGLLGAMLELLGEMFKLDLYDALDLSRESRAKTLRNRLRKADIARFTSHPSQLSRDFHEGGAQEVQGQAERLERV